MADVKPAAKTDSSNKNASSAQHKITNMVNRFITNTLDKGKGQALTPENAAELQLDSAKDAVNVNPKREMGVDYKYVIRLGNVYLGRTAVTVDPVPPTQWYVAGKAPGGI